VCVCVCVVLYASWGGDEGGIIVVAGFGVAFDCDCEVGCEVGCEIFRFESECQYQCEDEYKD
jgi:hypothetical protein